MSVLSFILEILAFSAVICLVANEEKLVRLEKEMGAYFFKLNGQKSLIFASFAKRMSALAPVLVSTQARGGGLLAGVKKVQNETKKEGTAEPSEKAKEPCQNERYECKLRP